MEKTKFWGILIAALYVRTHTHTHTRIHVHKMGGGFYGEIHLDNPE